MKNLFSKICTMLIIIASIAALCSNSDTAKAEYSASYVIDDNVFLNSTAMSANDINDFLINKGSWLANYVIPEYVSVPYPLASGGLAYVNARQVNTVTGHILYNKTVAQLIYDECIEHNVNPRVILTILQKESSAITKNQPSSTTTRAWPLFYAYDEAMEACLKFGTSCNDSYLRERSENFGGVGLQITYATAWFQKRFNEYNSSRDFSVTIDSNTIICQNAATRIMYIYTPHIGSWLNFYNIFTSWWEDPTYGPPAPNQAYLMTYIKSFPQRSWDINKSTKTISGDFDNDGKSDVAAMYDYGNEAMSLFVFESSNNFSPRTYLSLPINSWNTGNCSNIISGRYDADNLDDVAVMYNYGRESVGFWVFESQNSFKPKLYRYIPAGNWNFAASSEIASGNFNSNAKSDIALMYDYGNSNSALWVLESSNNYQLKNYFTSGANGINLKQTKNLVSGNFDGSGYNDLAFMYDYGNNRMGIITIKSSTNYRASTIYSGSSGGWYMPAAVNLIAGDYDDADTLTDLMVMYDYGQLTVGLISFNSNNSYNPMSRYWSGRRNFAISATNHRSINGDFNSDGKDDIAIMYTYGNESMAIFSFARTEYN